MQQTKLEYPIPLVYDFLVLDLNIRQFNSWGAIEVVRFVQQKKKFNFIQNLHEFHLNRFI